MEKFCELLNRNTAILVAFCSLIYFLRSFYLCASNSQPCYNKVDRAMPNVKVDLDSLVNGLSCPQSGKMVSDDSFWSQIDKM